MYCHYHCQKNVQNKNELKFNFFGGLKYPWTMTHTEQEPVCVCAVQVLVLRTFISEEVKAS